MFRSSTCTRFDITISKQIMYRNMEVLINYWLSFVKVSIEILGM